MAAEPENLALAASLLGAVVPKLRVSARQAETDKHGPAQLYGRTVTCLCNGTGIVQQISPNAREVLGEACDRAAELQLSLCMLLQPEDPADGERAVQELLRATTGAASTLNLLTRAPSGDARWLEIWCCNLVDDVAVGAYLLEIRDVTTQRVDDRLRTLLSAAVQYLPESVMLTDPAGVIRYVNPAFERASGYSAAEVLGRTPALLNSGTHAPEFFQKMWRTLAAGETWEGEICNRSQNGELFHQRILMGPVYSEQGDILYFVSTARNVAQYEAGGGANHDPLTGLPFPVLLRERALPTLALACRRGHSAALVHLDISGLRGIENAHDREPHDELLRRLAERVRHNLRDGDSLARLDGTDEFLILLADVQDEEDAARVLRRLFDAAGQPLIPGENGVALGLTAGVALCPQDAVDFDELTTLAARALDHARAAEQPVHFARSDATEQINERFSLERDLTWAWERGQFLMNYRPIAAAAGSGSTTVAAVAQIGWPHLERGLIEAHNLAPLAERTGHIDRLNRWAVETAADQLARWSLQGWNGWFLVTLLGTSWQDADFASFVADCLKRHELPPGRIVLELPMASALDAERCARAASLLREAGAGTAATGLGIAPISMPELCRIPLDMIRLEYEQVNCIGYDDDAERLLRAIAALACQMGARLLAEGVEDEEQREWLIGVGCDFLLGPMFGAAQPAETFEVPRSAP